MAERSVALWHRNGLFIDAILRDSGALVFQGQHLRGGGEYEYALTVPADKVPVVIGALGGEPGTDVLPLLRANAESIVRQGEKSWLHSIGITPEFWSHGDWSAVLDD